MNTYLTQYKSKAGPDITGENFEQADYKLNALIACCMCYPSTEVIGELIMYDEWDEATSLMQLSEFMEHIYEEQENVNTPD